MKKSGTSFQKMLNMCESKALYIILENRPKKYMFGLKHYGDIPGTLNKADGDPWDVAVPGYTNLPIGQKLKLKKLLGVMMLENGNHKLIIDVHTNQRKNHNQALSEIKQYQKRYTNYTHIPSRVIIFK